MSGRWAMLRGASERKRTREVEEGALPRPALANCCDFVCCDHGSNDCRNCRAAVFARAMRMYIACCRGSRPCAGALEVQLHVRALSIDPISRSIAAGRVFSSHGLGDFCAK